MDTKRPGPKAARETLETLRKRRSNAEYADRTQWRLAQLENLNLLEKVLARALEDHQPTRDAEDYVTALVIWLEFAAIAPGHPLGTVWDKETAEQVSPIWERAFGDLLIQIGTHWGPCAKVLGAKADPQRDEILAGLRRYAITVRAATGGGYVLRALGATDIHRGTSFTVLRRRAVHALLGGGNGPKLQVIRSALPEYTAMPADLPDKSTRMEGFGYKADLRFVPKAEQRAVLYAMGEISGALDGKTSKPLELRGSVWPLTVFVPGGTARYEFYTDQNKVIRAERLGDGGPRPLPAFMTGKVSVNDRKAALIEQYKLAGVDGRGRKVWTADELGQVAAAFERIPAADRPALQGFTLVRDGSGGANSADVAHGGTTHIGESNADNPNPPEHGPPHVHYYEPVFTEFAGTACGPPGDSGPGGDWTLLHEIGHVTVLAKRARLDAELTRVSEAARIARDAFYPLAKRLHTSNPPIIAYNAWVNALKPFVPATDEYSRAAHAVYEALDAADVAKANQLQAKLDETRRLSTSTGKAISDALPEVINQYPPDVSEYAKTATESYLARHELITQIASSSETLLRFLECAKSANFAPFTEYGTSKPHEWLAETYFLYTADPECLWQLNWKMYHWFANDRPAFADWKPTPP
ncbi:hypothetical protein [Spongiactinospora sp. TRM90649]|uniref:hypothetical protein n=1 Tax=Spongiactinospora sp. TRM90649 TaxID=3031114 RepID=UPI0023F62058|nr:hypothetical protein [Spongiactinospora sp. TRM90649]MDF5759330.1 hypothetical protein [Spongiactinospora sp. TRM90649]